MKNNKAYIFNAYGTILDPYLPFLEHSEQLGENAQVIYKLWLTKRLQYSSQLSLMNQYTNYETIRKNALDFACDVYGVDDEKLKSALLTHSKLDCYPDTKDVLESLKNKGRVTGVLSNGAPQKIGSTLKEAGVDHLIDVTFSTDIIRAVKPSPAVYEFVSEQIAIPRSNICFVSSNSWDIAGASACGFYTVWVNRYDHIPERLPYKANLVIKSLSELSTLI
ncbi:MAG: haloacid dehalogenase type II [Gammaproteobacteria bacterium]|nr:haloacid dehalogenase type II [Gammaproteobacteria bacterium]